MIAPKPPLRFAFIGLGLIGGSFARALRDAGQTSHITGFDLDPKQCQDALQLGVIDTIASNPQDAVKSADIIVLAVPVLHTGEALSAILPALQQGAIVTDVGSTKQSVLAEVQQICGGQIPPWFVAAHPIAGTEKSGVAASIQGLFKDKRVVLTPHPQQDQNALALIEQLWAATGARIVQMNAEEHDAIFAATSHLPHVLAFAFVDMLSQLPDAKNIFPNAGGGFRDFTRIASSSPEMWHDIVRANATQVSKLLNQQISELQLLANYIERREWDALKASFIRARNAREDYLSQID